MAQVNGVRGQGPGADADCGLQVKVSPMRTTIRLDLPSIHAVRAIYTALQGVEGILQANVSRGGATIEHDGRATAKRLREAVETAGYAVMEVVEDSRRLPVKGD